MKHEHTSRSASEKLESRFPNFYVAGTTRGGLCRRRRSRLLQVRDGQAIVLHIRIAGRTGSVPDEIGWFFHRLS